MRMIMLVCAALYTMLIGCMSPSNVPSNILTATVPVEIPLPFVSVSPAPNTSFSLAEYQETLESIGPNKGVGFVLSPAWINPMVADENGTIVYNTPQLIVDGVQIVTPKPILQDFVTMGCISKGDETCEDEENMMGIGPFGYAYPITLERGIHYATARWEAYDGQIHEYSWSFTIVD